MIKKVMIVGAMASLLLMACSSQSTDKINSSNIDTSTVAKQEITASDDTVAVTEGKSTKPIALQEENVKALRQEIAAIEGKVENYTVNGTAEENRAAYMAVDQEIELIEDQIDQYDDGIEADYYAGTMTQAEYQEKKYQLDQFEHRLDVAEEALQLKSGLDD